jgi:hypothetical protein
MIGGKSTAPGMASARSISGESEPMREAAE